MKNYCIYKHTNIINGKVYIGQTCQVPEYRWGKNGERYEACPRFYNAIKKYGWDNFKHEIILTNLTAEEANIMEEKIIASFNSTDENFGYNLQKGGTNRTEVAEETRNKLSQAMTKRWSDPEAKEHYSQIMKEKWQDSEYRNKVLQARKDNPHKLSKQAREKISKARKEYIAKFGTPTQGKQLSPETKQKIRESKLGEKNPMYGKTTSDLQKQKTKERCSCPIQCLETGQIFSSRKEAAAWCGLKSSSVISDQLAGRKKSAGKHPETGVKLHWKNIAKK